jgi:hypothetical protein
LPFQQLLLIFVKPIYLLLNLFHCLF